MTTRYRQSWHALNEQTFAFDYDFTLSMPDYKVTGDGDSFKEYEGTIKASGKDMADAKKKAEKELMRRIDSAEKATKGSLEDNISSILQTGKAVSEGLKEFTLVHVVRYRDPLNKKRFAVPFKTKEKAQAKMDQLKRDGVKEIEITQDTLRGNVKFKEVVEGTIIEDGHEDVSSSKRMAQVIGEDAQLISQELNKKSSDETLPTWWTNKLATSAHNMNAARDYITNDIKEGKDDAYAIGMSVAKKKMNDEPPLEKKTIEKGHEIAKAILKKEDVAINMLEAMSPAQIKKLKDSWADIKLMSPEKVKTLKNFLDKYSTDTLMQLSQAGINFVSNMARSVASRRKVGDMKHAGSMKEETTDSERMAKMRVSQMKLQTKLRDLDVGNPNDKTKIAITKNDLENIQMKMDQLKNKREQKEHPAKALYEKIAGLKKKADKTGMPYSILKQVYNRGMAAWKGGHRPGTTPQQWAMARVNSFVTKSSGTWGGADKDLAKKVRSSK